MGQPGAPRDSRVVMLELCSRRSHLCLESTVGTSKVRGCYQGYDHPIKGALPFVFFGPFADGLGQRVKVWVRTAKSRASPILPLTIGSIFQAVACGVL
ncbi:Uncharacterized protein HZ326_26763 [Fusarium oxysporum f. sp. albedinis]|nr:Uncharacterized protein HZ326_26763 [Fusarium oxysporum f. sp. albedinis]